jgi:hypothetical protein
MIRRTQTLVLLYKSAQNTRTKFGLALIQASQTANHRSSSANRGATSGLSSPLRNHNHKNTTFTVCQGWRFCLFHDLKSQLFTKLQQQKYYSHSLPRVVILCGTSAFHTYTTLHSRPFWNVVKAAVVVRMSVLNLVLILWVSEFDSWKTDNKILYFWHS